MAIRDRPDQWVPVLFTRVISGRIWYVPGVSSGETSFGVWPALINASEHGACTPILGPGLVEPYVGSSRDIARRWTASSRVPLAALDSGELRQVAQYLSVAQTREYALQLIREDYRNEVLHRFGGAAPDGRPEAGLEEVLADAMFSERRRDPSEPHGILARCPFPVYITTNWDGLLERALVDASKAPRVDDYPWDESSSEPERSSGLLPDASPSPDRPQVYHLFGRMERPESLVLTEDDCFDCLMGLSKDARLDSEVKRALSNRAMLFLGFQMNDWSFRAVFHLMSSSSASSTGSGSECERRV
ncbi:MAG: SIR2 family protein [Isosphaerales bacterium]